MRPISSRPRHALRALAAAAGLAAPACAAAVTARPPEVALPAPLAGAPTSPGPAPRLRAFDAVEVNARCEQCHSEIAREWRASLHRQSHTSPTYRDQLAREPRAFCDGCHAPEADTAAPVAEGPSRMGVGCVTCHVVGDRILAAPAPAGARPHYAHESLARTEDFAGPWACAPCHELAFPDARRGPRPLLMQSTITEHARSAHRDDSCASCHMPVRGGPTGTHRDHTFSASRDPDLVRSALVLREEPFDGRALRLILAPGRVGHAFPTGDMLRRLSLTIEVTAAGGEVIAREQRHLARHFAFVRTPTTPIRRVLVGDDRVGASSEPVVVDYPLPAAPEGGRLHYVLQYERVANPEGDEHRGPVIEGSIVLADRTLPLPSAGGRETGSTGGERETGSTGPLPARE